MTSMANERELEGRVALVTGASRNIGRAIALALAGAGAAIVVNARTSREEAQAVVSEIAAAGGKAMAHLADVSDERAVHAMAQAALERFGRLDVLVNNAAIRDVTYQPLLLFLIIFAWTPPHFWALALYRRKEYARAGLPMLPVTHGEKFTRLHLLLYTLILVAATLLPFATHMAGWFYLGAAGVLDAVFLGYAVALWLRYSDALARRTFAYSIFYLAMLFAALMIDHYLPLAGK